MNGAKPWYLSKGVVGGLVSAVAGVAGAFGIVTTPEFQVQAVDAWMAVAAAVSAVAGVISAWGRMRASSRIG